MWVQVDRALATSRSPCGAPSAAPKHELRGTDWGSVPLPVPRDRTRTYNGAHTRGGERRAAVRRSSAGGYESLRLQPVEPCPVTFTCSAPTRAATMRSRPHLQLVAPYGGASVTRGAASRRTSRYRQARIVYGRDDVAPAARRLPRQAAICRRGHGATRGDAGAAAPATRRYVPLFWRVLALNAAVVTTMAIAIAIVLPAPFRAHRRRRRRHARRHTGRHARSPMRCCCAMPSPR